MAGQDQDAVVRTILGETKRIAVVGASPDPARPSNGVFGTMLDAGYDVVPVNPNATKVRDRQVFPSLTDVTPPIDLVDVFRRAEHAPDIVRQAIEVGARAVWLQLGVISEEARAIAEDAGLPYVEDVCIAQQYQRFRDEMPLPPRP